MDCEARPPERGRKAQVIIIMNVRPLSREGAATSRERGLKAYVIMKVMKEGG
jgi:hypothetical protein